MKIRVSLALFVLCVTSLFALASSSSSATESKPAAEGATHSNDLGFSYSLPSDWVVEDTAPMLPAAQQHAANSTTSAQGKKDAGCMQLPLKATHGDPASTVVVVGLTYDCAGQRFTDADLAGFAGGVAGSLKKTWTIIDPVYGAYMLGTHSLWIERAVGNPIAHPETKRTIEVVCGMLKNSAVCWMAFFVNDKDLTAFEGSRVSLDGEPTVGLVAKSALAKKP
jgi:hypothetical protein